MMELEKVIKGLEKIAEFFKARGDMAVGDGKMLLLSWMRAAEDAIALLEAQEPIDGDTISRSALLAAYDAAHKGPPGGARKLIEEAPAVVLKAQEPRVLTLEEAVIAELVYYEPRYVHHGVTNGLFPVIRKVDRFCDRVEWYSPYFPDGKVHCLFTPDEYGVFSRCWTSRPTDEQREAAAWP